MKRKRKTRRRRKRRRRARRRRRGVRTPACGAGLGQHPGCGCRGQFYAAFGTQPAHTPCFLLNKRSTFLKVALHKASLPTEVPGSAVLRHGVLQGTAPVSPRPPSPRHRVRAGTGTARTWKDSCPLAFPRSPRSFSNFLGRSLAPLHLRLIWMGS